MGKRPRIKGSRDIDKAFRRHPDGEIVQCKGSHKKGRLNGKTVMTYYAPKKQYPTGIRRKFEKKLLKLGLILLPWGVAIYYWKQAFDLLFGG